MSQSPAISVLMANHNGGAYVEPAVRSVLQQTCEDFELIIIDDGSTDDSPATLRRLAEHDRRIRLVARGNVGLTPSLNEAAKLATAPLLARMDSDDLCLPGRLAIQKQFMDRHPEVVLLGGAYELIDEAGRRIHRMNPPADDATLQQHCLSGRTPICHPLAMFRRQAFERVGGYDESYRVAQDLDLWLRLGEVGQLACVPELLLRYRMHADSVSERKQLAQIEAMRRACETAYRRRGITGTFAGESGWRADGSRSARRRQATQYGWWAWKLGERRTALHYGCRAVRIQPWCIEGWRLLAIAALKRPAPEGNEP